MKKLILMSVVILNAVPAFASSPDCEDAIRMVSVWSKEEGKLFEKRDAALSKGSDEDSINAINGEIKDNDERVTLAFKLAHKHCK